jgi:hypothetical protein
MRIGMGRMLLRRGMLGRRMACLYDSYWRLFGLVMLSIMY